MKDDIKSSTPSDALHVGSLVSKISQLRLTINCEELTVSEMRLLFRFVNGTMRGTSVALEPADWLEKNLGLALLMSLAPLEIALVPTKNS